MFIFSYQQHKNIGDSTCDDDKIALYSKSHINNCGDIDNINGGDNNRHYGGYDNDVNNNIGGDDSENVYYLYIDGVKLFKTKNHRSIGRCSSPIIVELNHHNTDFWEIIKMSK